MKLKPHNPAERKMFEDWLPSHLSFLDRTRQKAAEGRAGQVAYSTLVDGNLKLASVALMLGRGDEEALKHFREAVHYGMGLLDAPSGKEPRIYEMEVNITERGSELSVLHEKVPPPGPRPLAIIDFSRVLFPTMAFGTDEQRAKVGGYPEEKYRSPEVIAPESMFQHFRGLKAWLRGEEALAKREVESALGACDEAGGRALMATFLAVATADQAAFEKYLEERLKAHKKQYQKKPSDPMGFVCLDGLGLCRLALERSLRVEEWPYLPVRLLPSYQPAVH